MPCNTSEKCPACRLVFPRAEAGAGGEIGLAPERLVAINAGEEAALGPHAAAEALPAAHERLQVNERGEYRHLGYLLDLGGARIYHSGDCVEYAGLADALRERGVQVALLPVNGRDEYRAARGILGNFTFDEAVSLCERAGIDVMIAHHWGMFAFNTVDPAELRAAVAALRSPVRVLLPSVETALVIA